MSFLDELAKLKLDALTEVAEELYKSSSGRSPDDLSDEELHKCIDDANKLFYEKARKLIKGGEKDW